MSSSKRKRIDLTPSPKATAQLAEIASAVASARGAGVSVLFLGPPGAGKSAAARTLAEEMKREFLRVDLSRVVSKYIGETEKNLAKIFAEAAGKPAVLFFDEADALFGKRSEVKDAHDRYANAEVGYLLKRMEEHTGLCILAITLERKVDEAFVRRLHFCVEFPAPATP